MKRKPIHPDALRATAEAQSLQVPATELKDERPTEELLHELRVHQIELEMQSEEMRRSYLALEKSHALYTNLYDFAPVGYFSLSDMGLITKINLTAANLFGMDRNKLLNCRFAALVAPEDADQWYLFFSSVLKHDIHQNIELTMKRADGIKFQGQLNCISIPDDDNDSILRVALTDITQIKQAENNLRKAETNIAISQAAYGYVRSLFEASLDPLITINPAGQITDVNTATERITGLNRNALIGSDFTSYFTEPEQAQKVYKQVFAQGCITDYPLVIRHVSGKVVDVMYNASVYGDAQGNVQGVLATARDMTERKKFEAALLQAKTAAETANIAKSTFIATMSHELRTPLNAILGFSELMSMDETLTAAQKETLDIINRSGAHLLGMINDVLDISKIETGHLELNIQAFDLINLLRDIDNMVRVRAENKRLSFSLEISSDLPHYIQSDSGKLRQILINLLGNAIKFTKHGGIILRAHAKPLPTAAMVMLIIEVTDSGIGIDSARQQELFKPFAQFNHDDLDVKGTGLGLAISKSLVELMGGCISVTSILEIGSTFKMELPVAIASADDITVEEQHRPVKSIAPDQPQWRLLIADDNLDNRLLLDSLLTGVGFQVREAENGQEAISMFEQWQPHLIWMDMRMPLMNGYEAAAKIRQLDSGHDVKIIAMTASAFKEQHDSIINAGCDAVVIKPFHMSEVFAALTKHLGVKFIYRDNPAPTATAPLTVTAAMLAKLPSALLQQLHEAAMTLDTEETETVIAQIRQLAPNSADALDELLKNYQYNQIIDLTKADNIESGRNL